MKKAITDISICEKTVEKESDVKNLSLKGDVKYFEIETIETSEKK